jgi:hypothetical protein
LPGLVWLDKPRDAAALARERINNYVVFTSANPLP